MQEEQKPAAEAPTTWEFRAEDQAAVYDASQNVATTAEVSWTASEFIAHEKGADWYLKLAVVAVIVSGVAFLITSDAITVMAIVFVTVMFGVMAARKPRTLEYHVDRSGIHVGPKTYPFANFKSFTVLEEGAFSSIMLMPLKRFMPPLSLYYPPEQEESIVDALADYLPHEDREHDALERLMRRVRF